MPIDRKKYHPKWSLICYLLKRYRAKNRCEVCGVGNYAVGYWDNKTWYNPDQADPPAAGFDGHRDAKAWVQSYNDEIGELYDPDTRKICVIKLGVAHLDHDEQNNRFWNLKVMCQLCHLTHDRADNANRRRYGPTGRHHKQIRIEL